MVIWLLQGEEGRVAEQAYICGFEIVVEITIWGFQE